VRIRRKIKKRNSAEGKSTGEDKRGNWKKKYPYRGKRKRDRHS